MALTRGGFFDGQGAGDKHIQQGRAPGALGTGDYSQLGMSGSAPNADSEAAAIYGAPGEQNATRMNRMTQLGDVVGDHTPGTAPTHIGDFDIQDAFIDGSNPAFTAGAKTLNDGTFRQTFDDGGLPGEMENPTYAGQSPIPSSDANDSDATITGNATGFPGIGDDTYYPTGSPTTPQVSNPAPTVGRPADRQGNTRQAGNNPAVKGSPGFPFLP